MESSSIVLPVRPSEKNVDNQEPNIFGDGYFPPPNAHDDDEEADHIVDGQIKIPTPRLDSGLGSEAPPLPPDPIFLRDTSRIVEIPSFRDDVPNGVPRRVNYHRTSRMNSLLRPMHTLPHVSPSPSIFDEPDYQANDVQDLEISLWDFQINTAVANVILDYIFTCHGCEERRGFYGCVEHDGTHFECKSCRYRECCGCYACAGCALECSECHVLCCSKCLSPAYRENEDRRCNKCTHLVLRDSV